MKKFLGLLKMTLDYCCRLPKWQAVKRRSLMYGRMGNSRKYPYHTTDSFHILPPPPPALGFLKCIIALCPQNSMIVNLLPIWIFAFSKAFSRNTLSVCPLWKFQVYPPPPPCLRNSNCKHPPPCLWIPCLALGIPLSRPWYGMDIF